LADRSYIIFTDRMQKASLVLLNGKIATMDEKNPWLSALAISGERIIYTGSEGGAKDYISRETEVIDLKGRLVLPGFNDAHLHFAGAGLMSVRVNLRDCESFQEIKKRVLEKVKKLKTGSWILGRGWDHNLFNQGNWPDKTILDEISTNHPVFLKRIDGHAAWANSLTLKLAEINKDTSSPEGGIILKDSHTGEPTGILMENAIEVVDKIIPLPTFEEHISGIREAMKEAKRYGVTSIQDNSDFEVIEVYNKLLEKNELKTRISEWIPLESIKNPEELNHWITSFPEESNILKPGLLKIIADGTLGSHTAYLFEPYSDEPDKTGMLLFKEKELEEMVFLADKSGYQVGIHAIGDRASNVALSIYEKIQKSNPERKRRHRIEHCSLLREKDIARFAESGVIASVQPTFWPSDEKWLEQRLGKERARKAYPFRSLLESGVVLAFGTDWPIEPLNPMLGIHSAVTRDRERLSVEQAVRAYTWGSAYAEFQEREKGSLEVGKLADIVVLSKDIFTIAPEEILETEVEMTVLGGEIVYSRQ